MIRICTSHRTEALLDAFAANLADERKQRGPLEPVRVVVPNRNVETFLRLRVCEWCGIAANLETTFLRRFLSSIAEKANPGLRVADAAHVEGHLLALLHDEALLAQPDLADVRRYLAAAEGDRDALDRRRWQLATQLGQLFDEYAGARPDLLSAWAKGKRADSDGATAVWQRALWLAVFGPAGRLAQASAVANPTGGLQVEPLEALWSLAMQGKPVPLAGQSVHVFGLSYVATAYHRMLAELAREAEVLIYTLSPCQESRDEPLAARASSSDDPFGLDQEAQLALRLWARPGRENLRLLAGLPGASVDARFPTEAGLRQTVLRTLQDQIVHREQAAPPAAAREPDDSLQVIPCPSLRRELEVVAAEIWALARRDPSLQLCDVVVIVPEASKDLYLTQVSAVFRESCELPHNVADLPASAGHRVAQAIEYLLDLPFSSLSRKEMLPLVTHPCLMARFPDATPAMWYELCDQLGIVRGADRGDFEAQYPTRDLFSWDQGLRRLVLGAFADGANADAADPLQLGTDVYLPGPRIGDDDESRLGFGLLARSLLADARFAWKRDKPPERPLGEWLTFIRGMVDGYLVLDEDDGAGQAVVAEFTRRLEDVADIGLGEQPVSYRVAAELARRELAGLPWSRGRYLSSGVTVSSFVPMRAIPFRAVFVLGLGQGAFPRPAGRGELDLRQGGRRAGDVDRREQDLYMFLETLLSARDRVVLSYVARDEVTGEELPASSVLLELRSVLGQGILDAAGLDRLFCTQKDQRPPLRRYDDRPDRRAVLPAAEAEHRARALGEILRPDPYASAPVAGTIAALPTPIRTAVARMLGVPSLPTTSGEENSGPLLVPLATLRRFLEDPLQGSARFRLGLRDDDDEGLADVEDEPFDMGNRDRTTLLSASMATALLEAQAVPGTEAVNAAYHRKALAAELGGQAPTAIFREAEARRQQETLSLWQIELLRVLGPASMQVSPVRFSLHADGLPEKGDTGRGPVVFRPAPSLTLPGLAGPDRTNVEIRITGQTGLCALDANCTGTTLAFTWRDKIAGQPLGKEDLRAFLDYVVLTATEPESSRPGHRSALFYRSKGDASVHLVEFAPLARERAIEYLTRLCDELVAYSPQSPSAGLHPYLLPHEAVLVSHARGTNVRQEIQNLSSGSERDHARFSSLWGPVPDVLARYGAPSEEEARRMVDVRFGLFFELAKASQP